MVAAGQAVSYLSDRYAAEEKTAKMQKSGIWQGKFMRPALYRAMEREKSTNGAKLILRNVKFKKNVKKLIKKLNIVNINKKPRCVLL